MLEACRTSNGRSTQISTTKTYDSRPALHWAVLRNNQRAIDYLISVGANVNQKDGKGDYPINHAAYDQNSDSSCQTNAKKLLNAGANVNLLSKNVAGFTTRFATKKKGMSGCEKVLKDAGGKCPKGSGSDWNCPTYQKWDENTCGCVCKGCSSGYRQNSDCSCSRICNSSYDIAYAIYNNNVDWEMLEACRTSNGRSTQLSTTRQYSSKTPLSWAVYKNNQRALDYLISVGANVNQKDGHNYYPINHVAYGSNTDSTC
jgi:hypothetical protein